MKKFICSIFIIITIMSSLVATAQDDDLKGKTYSWVLKSTHYTQWETIDTISKKPIKDNKRDWYAYRIDDDVDTSSSLPLINYSPFTKNKKATRKFEEFRICKITGIRQHKYLVQEFELVAKKRYEVIIDSLKSLKK